MNPMSLMPLNAFTGQRRNPLVGARMGTLGGGIGSGGTLGGMGGMVPFGSVGALELARYGRLSPKLGLGYGGVGAGSLGMRGVSPLLAGRGLLGTGHSDALLRGGRHPDLGRRGLDELLLSSSLSRYPYRDLETLPGVGGRGLCDGRGYRSGLGCGYDRRCEHERGLYDCFRCSGSSSSSSSKDLKTKDIVVRGKTYQIRKSFLADSSKFEADIVKLLDKKSEEAVPNDVVQMLVDFINTERCDGRTLLDVVSMGILASNLGVKSAVEYSLNLLKRHELDYGTNSIELTHICLAIMESSKVDDKLVEWLKKYLKSDGREHLLGRSPYYHEILNRKPELGLHLMQLLGQLEKDDNVGTYRIL